MGEVRSPRILMAVQQLRRTVPGGIGAYARGLLTGLAQATEGGVTSDITLYASRPRRGRSGGGADPLSRFGHPVVGSRLPGPIMTRAWDHGWLAPASGFDVIHSVSLAAPPARASRGERTVVTVHDLSWRRYPEGSTPRGRRWHEAALVRARDSAAALVVTSNFGRGRSQGRGCGGRPHHHRPWRERPSRGGGHGPDRRRAGPTRRIRVSSCSPWGRSNPARTSDD